MSLVDYASSDDEDEPQHSHPLLLQPSTSSTTTTTADNLPKQHQQQPTSSCLSPSPSQSSTFHTQSTGLVDPPSLGVSSLLPPPVEKLPDASMLLNSPILIQSAGTDHSARVAAAMAENASRKREANRSGSSSIRGKIPRGDLPHSKNIPDTGSGLLMPPQLLGRSNVVTEDISKLFVRGSSRKNS